MNKLLLIPAALAACCAAAPPAMTVYTVHDLARVRPADAPGAARSVVVKAARNEYAPFQIVVRAGGAGLRGVTASAGDLGGKSGRISAANITLYREHYVEVRTPSPKSKEGAGWYPDALIPFLDPATGRSPVKSRFSAAPFDVAADSNQPLWVDVWVPKGATPGEYHGFVTITAGVLKPVKVPVALTVWDFTLPDTPTMRTHFGGYENDPLNSTPGSSQTLERQYAAAVSAHRLCAPVPRFLRPHVREDGSTDPPDTAALRQWISQYRITGFPIPLLGKDPAGADRERNIRYLRAMYEYLRENGWEKLAYVYALDEPNTATAYDEVRKRARFIHETQPGLKVLCTEQPDPQDAAWGNLFGSVDIWVPLWPLWKDDAVAERLAAGDEVWSYTALCQGRDKPTPFWQLDFPALNYRIPMWTSFRYGATGLLYWQTLVWRSTNDVWTDPLSFRKQYNLEGALFYPGADAGVQGFVSSIRLKQLREGLEDYEYFKLLAGRDSEAALNLVKSVARSWFDWDQNPTRLYAVREQAAVQIAGRKR